MGFQLPSQNAGDAALPDTGLARQERHLSITGPCRVPPRHQQFEFSFPTHEWRQAFLGGGLEPIGRLTDARDDVGVG